MKLFEVGPVSVMASWTRVRGAGVAVNLPWTEAGWETRHFRSALAELCLSRLDDRRDFNDRYTPPAC